MKMFTNELSMGSKLLVETIPNFSTNAHLYEVFLLFFTDFFMKLSDDYNLQSYNYVAVINTAIVVVAEV